MTSRIEFQQYLSSIRSELRATIEPKHLKKHVGPNIVSTIDGFMPTEPAELKDSVQEILRKVVPKGRKVDATQKEWVDAMWDIHIIVGFSQAPVEVEVVSLAGDELFKSNIDLSAGISHIRHAVAEAMSVAHQSVQLVLGSLIVKDCQFLSDHAQEGERLTLCAAVISWPDIAGVYAAFTCSIFVFKANGDVFDGWYDDFWDSPLKQCCVQRDPEEWASHPPTGTWTYDISVGKIAGECRGMKFEAEVVHSDEGLVEGISTLTLQANLYHSFLTDKEPEKKTYYLVAPLP